MVFLFVTLADDLEPGDNVNDDKRAPQQASLSIIPDRLVLVTLLSLSHCADETYDDNTAVVTEAVETHQ
ncbi:unnamed protein product [Heligmosomoides polygyrus]|uniref:Secreted protein n=1 Tax=Heligmosomoides polygyrus TaxID=6339 RepID=A0A183FQC3_HELPZ|nr:unnamed protein product [Heligmosomoides polygyrus]